MCRRSGRPPYSVTASWTSLLVWPDTTTAILAVPGHAPPAGLLAGMVKRIEVSDQDVDGICLPLRSSWPPLCESPSEVPVIVTVALGAAWLGFGGLIIG